MVNISSKTDDDTKKNGRQNLAMRSLSDDNQGLPI
jgi:hypothetical protein